MRLGVSQDSSEEQLDCDPVGEELPIDQRISSEAGPEHRLGLGSRAMLNVADADMRPDGMLATFCATSSARLNNLEIEKKRPCHCESFLYGASPTMSAFRVNGRCWHSARICLHTRVKASWMPSERSGLKRLDSCGLQLTLSKVRAHS